VGDKATAREVVLMTRIVRFTFTLTFLVLITVLPAAAQAAPCPTTTVADLLTIGTCSIGNTIFTFTEFHKGLFFDNGKGVDASAITFVPLTSDAARPGFRVSSPAFTITNDELGEQLLFTVTVGGPGFLMSGFSVAMNNPSIVHGGSTSRAQFETARLGLALVSPSPSTSTFAGFQESCDFISGCATGPTSAPPVVVSPGVSVMALSFSLQHLIGGTGSFDSVDAFIQETADPVTYTYSSIDHPKSPGDTAAYGINNSERSSAASGRRSECLRASMRHRASSRRRLLMAFDSKPARSRQSTRGSARTPWRAASTIRAPWQATAETCRSA